MAKIIDHINNFELELTLIKLSSIHNGWLGFNVNLKNIKTGETLSIEFSKSNCFIADKDQADDIGELTRQFQKNQINWANSDEGDFIIKGSVEGPLTKLFMTLNDQSCEIQISTNLFRSFLEKLNAESKELIAKSNNHISLFKSPFIKSLLIQALVLTTLNIIGYFTDIFDGLAILVILILLSLFSLNVIIVISRLFIKKHSIANFSIEASLILLTSLILYATPLIFDHTPLRKTIFPRQIELLKENGYTSKIFNITRKKFFEKEFLIGHIESTTATGAQHIVISCFDVHGTLFDEVELGFILPSLSSHKNQLEITVPVRDTLGYDYQYAKNWLGKLSEFCGYKTKIIYSLNRK